jgi:RimJ/RimL family protein N-acetyltransferase
MLKGERITLRPIEPGDAENINLLRQDFDAIKAFVGSPFPGNIISQQEWINSMYPNGILKNIYLAVEENESKKFIGYVAARNINYIHSHAEVGEILIGDSRGKGYFKDILKQFISYLFNQINLNKVFTSILIDNKISINAHKKFGFKEEGIMKNHYYQDGMYKDVIILSLFKSDFK